MLQRYLVVWLCLFSAGAYFWPVLTAWLPAGAPPAICDPWTASAPYLWSLIVVTMFAIGYMLPRDEVQQVARRWPTVLGGTAVQYTTMPLIAYLVGTVFRLDQATMIGIMIVGCVPGAMASNVLTLNARGNTSYSVSLTAMATLLSPLIVPFALWFSLGQEVASDPLGVAGKLALRVVLPVIAGHALRRAVPRWELWARPAATTVANLTILWIIAVVVGCQRAQLHWAALAFVVPLLLVNGAGYLAGYGGATAMRLPDPMRRALTLEVGMQNAGLGTVLAVNEFSEHPTAAILPAAYTFGCMLTGTLLARMWAAASERQQRRQAAGVSAEGQEDFASRRDS
jgi:BASS family bile acid:Na+ symporter